MAGSIKKVLKLVDRMKIKELRSLVYKSGIIFCLRHSNKCLPLASEKFVLASESVKPVTSHWARKLKN